MKALHVEQSLPICGALSAIGGILEVGATAVTAIPAVREKQGIEMKWWVQWVALLGNLLLQSVSTIMSHLFATWFGPVSLVVPFFYCATLLSNMLVLGFLGESFTKNMRVGTHVILIAVILLPIVGPNVQEDQDINVLMRHWYAIAWFFILLLACVSTAIILAVKDITSFPMNTRIVILLIARAASLSVNLTVSRCFIMGPPKEILVAFIVIKLFSGWVYTCAIIVQSYAVEQARFVPLNTTFVIILNAITGVIIWEDWRVIESWYGYICVFVLLGLGCDLLLSVPMLNEENPEFGAKRRTSMIMESTRKRFSNVSLDIPRLHQLHEYEEVPDVALHPKVRGFDESGAISNSRRLAWKEVVSPSQVSGLTYHSPPRSPTRDVDGVSGGGMRDLDGYRAALQDTRTYNWKQFMTPSKESDSTTKEVSPKPAAERAQRSASCILPSAPQQLSGIGDDRRVVTDRREPSMSRLSAWRATVSPQKTPPSDRTFQDFR